MPYAGRRRVEPAVPTGGEVRPRRFGAVRLAVALALCTAPCVVKAVDTFEVFHSGGSSGPCRTGFANLHQSWEGRARIELLVGETVRVRLYSHGADLATGLDRSGGVMASIVGRGTTTDYPNAPIRFGSRVAKGYVTVEITPRATGNQEVTVRWVTGTETIRLRGVADCAELADARYRVTPQPTGSAPRPPSRASGGSSTAQPNLLPQRASTAPLLRKINGIGGPIRVFDTFCNGVPLLNPTTVAVPPLVWGVSSANAAASGVRVELRNRATGAVLSSFVTGPLQSNGAAETRQNYPGRPASVQVIHLGKHVRADFPEFEGVPGCYLHGTAALSLTLDPPDGQLQIVVDPANAIDEGTNGEADNQLAF